MLVDDVISFIPNQALRIIQGKFYIFYRKRWLVEQIKEIKFNGKNVDLVNVILKRIVLESVNI